MPAAAAWILQLESIMTNDKLAEYYRNLPAGSTAKEPTTQTKPVTQEAIRERKLAIREGRLEVTDTQDPGRTDSTKCIGCGADVPLIRYPDAYPGSESGSDRPMGSGGNPGQYAHSDPTGAGPRVNFETNHPAFGSFALTLLQVTSANGLCVESGSDCIQAQQCGHVVEMTFTLTMIGSDGGPAPVLPGMQIRNPVTGLMTSVLQPTILPQTTPECVSGEYEFTFSISIDCDDQWIYRISMQQGSGTLSPTPATGTWSNQTVDTNWEYYLVLGCAKCVRGTKPAGG